MSEPANYNSDDALAVAYVRNWTEGGPESSSPAAYLDELVLSDPERAWRVILRIIAHDSSPLMLSIVGAGPLENLLCEHGSELIDIVSTEATRNSHVRQALSSVWGVNRMQPEVHQKLENIRSARG